MDELGGVYIYSSHFVLLLICVLLIVASTDKSNLYLKMFKLVFGSVTLFAQENELMLKVMF